VKYVYQTLFGAGGNCFQACAAAIMEVPLNEVSHFMEGQTEARPWTQEEWDEVRHWFRSHGYEITWLDPTEEFSREWIPKLFESGLHYIACVKSVFGGHSVVGHRGELVFCPNKGDTTKYGEPYVYYVLEPIDASTAAGASHE